MRHHERQPGVREQLARDATEEYLSQPGVAMSAGDEQVGSGGARFLLKRGRDPIGRDIGELD